MLESRLISKHPHLYTTFDTPLNGELYIFINTYCSKILISYQNHGISCTHVTCNQHDLHVCMSSSRVILYKYIWSTKFLVLPIHNEYVYISIYLYICIILYIYRMCGNIDGVYFIWWFFDSNRQIKICRLICECTYNA